MLDSSGSKVYQSLPASRESCISEDHSSTIKSRHSLTTVNLLDFVLHFVHLLLFSGYFSLFTFFCLLFSVYFSLWLLFSLVK
jgi:hypothetical protein